MSENAIITYLKEKNNGQIPFEGLLNIFFSLWNRLVEYKVMGNELMFISTYMASIITANITRPEIFSFTASRKEYRASIYYAKAEMLVKNWGYSYAQSLRMVAEKVKNSVLQSTLNRYANAIDSGVPDDDFIATELNTVRNVYRSTFEQGAEMLKKWGDAYIAMLLSGSLVAIIIMISVAIYAPEGIESSLSSSYGIIIAISVFGISIMYQAVPDDPKIHTLPICSKEQAVMRRIEKPSIIVSIVAVILLGLAGINGGVVFMVFGFIMLPIGIMAYIDDANVAARDEDFSSFIRSLGSIMGGKGITIYEALKEIDRKSLEHLDYFITSLQHKLNLGLNERLSWEKFVGETGSYLIYKYLNIFRDSIQLGGDADEIGKIVGSSMLEQTLLRRKRDMLVKGFIVLLVPMHAAMAGIFVFLFSILLTMSKAVTEVMTTFGETQAALSGTTAISGSGLSGMGLFENFPQDIMTAYVINILILLTLANTIAGKVVMGGGRHMFYFLLSLMSLLSGLVFLISPPIVEMMFAMPELTGGV